MMSELLEQGGHEPRRVLVAHNSYHHAGGEDAVVASEIDLLLRRGHEVVELRRNNAVIAGTSGAGLAVDSMWSRHAHAETRRLIDRHRPDVVHIHNTLPLLSPAIHWAASDAGVAVVQTLHNFRLVCPQAMFLRRGKVCEECLGRSPMPAVVHACYRGSRTQSGVVASMLVLHRAIGTWQNKVDRFIALSRFSRDKFIESGLPEDRIAVKPNFVEAGTALERHRRRFLFVGRLSEEKGISILADACVRAPHLAVRVIGSGPEVRHVHGVAGVCLMGSLDQASVRSEMERATALILPNLSYENFPRTVVEAFAAGLPVIASRLGSLPELVEEGATGLLFRAGDAADLARAMTWAEAHPERMAQMGRNARDCYESLYTPEINYGQLMTIYESAIETRRSRDAVRQA